MRENKGFYILPVTLMFDMQLTYGITTNKQIAPPFFPIHEQ